MLKSLEIEINAKSQFLLNELVGCGKVVINKLDVNRNYCEIIYELWGSDSKKKCISGSLETGEEYLNSWIIENGLLPLWDIYKNDYLNGVVPQIHNKSHKITMQEVKVKVLFIQNHLSYPSFLTIIVWDENRDYCEINYNSDVTTKKYGITMSGSIIGINNSLNKILRDRNIRVEWDNYRNGKVFK